MKVLTKREGEQIRIGEDVVLTVLAVGEGEVNVCVERHDESDQIGKELRLPRVAAELFSWFDRLFQTPSKKDPSTF